MIRPRVILRYLLAQPGETTGKGGKKEHRTTMHRREQTATRTEELHEVVGKTLSRTEAEEQFHLWEPGGTHFQSSVIYYFLQMLNFHTLQCGLNTGNTHIELAWLNCIKMTLAKNGCQAGILLETGSLTPGIHRKSLAGILNRWWERWYRIPWRVWHTTAFHLATKNASPTSS